MYQRTGVKSTRICSEGKQIYGAGNRTDCMGNGDGVRIRLGSLRCEEGRETWGQGSGSSQHYFRELELYLWAEDAQEGFRAGSAVIRRVLFLKALLRLSLSINFGAFLKGGAGEDS